MGKVAQEFAETFQEQAGEARVAQEFAEVFQVQGAEARVAQEFAEVFQVQAGEARITLLLVETFVEIPAGSASRFTMQGERLKASEHIQGVRLARKRGQA